MYVLIDTSKMDLVAKHPNFLVLYHLGIINCPNDCSVLPLDHKPFSDFTEEDLATLFVGVTCEIPDDDWDRSDLEFLLLNFLNEAPETILDAANVEAQALYAIEWGIEGYCSFLKGKKEPSMDEGLWQNITVPHDLDYCYDLLIELKEIEFKTPLQRAF